MRPAGVELAASGPLRSACTCSALFCWPERESRLVVVVVTTRDSRGSCTPVSPHVLPTTKGFRIVHALYAFWMFCAENDLPDEFISLIEQNVDQVLENPAVYLMVN